MVTVRKGNSQWQVFRRYKEWEELRMRLCQNFGNAPPMPGKMLFGRMRPEVRTVANSQRSPRGVACHGAPILRMP